MPHTPGPYVAIPRDAQMPGFYIYAVDGKHRHMIATTPPIGIVPTNKKGREEVEANANLFAAAPLMLLALEAIALDTSIPLDLQMLAKFAVKSATKGSTPATPPQTAP